MKAALLASLLASSCVQGLQPDFISECGARVFDMGDEPTSPAAFQALEDRIALTFTGNICEVIKDSIVSIQPTPSWTDEFGRHVGGVTRCGWNSIQVGAGLAAFAHEVKHLENCPTEDSTPEHVSFTKEDWQQIDAANNGASSK